MPCLLAQPQARFSSSGRASILLALEMLNVGKNDQVLVPTYHCPTMIAPIVARGAEPIFYPLDAHGSPCLQWLQRNDCIGARAILVAHFFGIPQPLSAIRQWCNHKQVRLIEDCAHALFGSSEGRPIGSWGDIAIASLTKFLPVPEGGCLVNNLMNQPVPPLHRLTARQQVKAALDIVHTSVNHGRLAGVGLAVGSIYGVRSLLKRRAGSTAGAPQPQPGAEADGFSIDAHQAHGALSLACQWVAKRTPRQRIVAHRRQNYLLLAQALSQVAGMRPLYPSLPDNCAPYVFPLWVDIPDPGYAELRRLEFPVSRWDRLWPTVMSITGDAGIEMSQHVLQLACHQDLTRQELQEMVDILKRIYAPLQTSP
jgi:perosamine synthetase